MHNMKNSYISQCQKRHKISHLGSCKGCKQTSWVQREPWCLQLQVSAVVQLHICKALLQVHKNLKKKTQRLQNGIQMRLFSITSPYVAVRIITYLLNRVQQLLGSHSSLSGKSVISIQLIWSMVLSLYWHRHAQWKTQLPVHSRQFA